jgi:GT2 family glycosyltransferase
MLSQPPLLSIVIAVTRPEALTACLQGLEAQTGSQPFEVFAVGDAAGVDFQPSRFSLTLVPCASRHANVRRNIGIARSRGALVGLLDDDTIPDPHWVETALALAPDGDTILTGPERPVAQGPQARLVYAVSRSKLGAGTKSHVNQCCEPVCWYQVPFCNCVIPRRIFALTGPLAEDIPWDMDDFEFCMRAREVARFANEPRLSLRHDRYPDSVLDYLRYRFRLRRRTGEKLISHPWLYGRILPVLVVAAFPWAAFLLTVLLSGQALFFWSFVAAFYGVGLLGHIPTAYGHGGWKTVLPYLGLMAAHHAVTVTGVSLGTLSGLRHYGFSGVSTLFHQSALANRVAVTGGSAAVLLLLLAAFGAGHWEFGPLSDHMAQSLLHDGSALGMLAVGAYFLLYPQRLARLWCGCEGPAITALLLPLLGMSLLFVVTHHPGDHVIFAHTFAWRELLAHDNITLELAALSGTLALTTLLLLRRTNNLTLRVIGLNTNLVGLFSLMAAH